MDPIEPYSRQDNLLQAEIEQLKLDLEFEMKKMEGDEKQREMREKSYLARLATLENQLEKANYELHVTTIATRSELREKRAKKKKEDPEVSIGKLQVKNRKLQKNIEEEKENGLDGKLMVVWMEGQRDRRVPRCGECGEEYDEKVKVPKVMDCGHSMCLPCCVVLVQGDTLRCSICRRFSRTPNCNVDRFPKNYALLSLIDSLTL